MTMSVEKLIIGPKTKVGELLDAYPGLEDILLEMSPAFSKLRNPVLRRTVAKVATLQQVAVVGNLNVEEIVNRLREAVGESGGEYSEEDAIYTSGEVPEWFDEKKITMVFDAVPVINSGGSPMADILKKAAELTPGGILELLTPFVPAPIIDVLKGKGYLVYCKKEDRVITFITKSEN